MYLMHYGVPGMKWGVRKAPTVVGNRRRSGTRGDSKKTYKKMSPARKVAIGAAIVGGTALAAYGGYRAFNLFRDRKTLRSVRLGAETLKKLGVVEEIPRIEIPKTKVESATIQTTKIQTKSLPSSGFVKMRESVPKTETKTSYSPKLSLDSSAVSVGEDYLSQILKNQQSMSDAIKKTKDMSKTFGDLDALTMDLLKKH